MKKRNRHLSALLALAMTIGLLAGPGTTAYADNSANLDLDAVTSTYSDTTTVDQNYKLTVNDGTVTNVTKVALSWETSDFSVSRTDNKTWNPDTLSWDTTSGNATAPAAVSANFTLTNYSSVKVNVTADFAVESGFTAPTVTYTDGTDTLTDGTITLDTASGNAAYSAANPPTGRITASFAPTAADFNSLAATTSAKYGTYTITLSEYTEPAQTVTYTLTSDFVPAGTTLSLSSADLLASSTLDYTYDSKTCTAYNGYISKTAYADWYDAINFVSELNGSATWGGKTYTLSTNDGTAYTLKNTQKIVPTGQTSGEWRLLSSMDDVHAWALASGSSEDTYKFSNYETKFDGLTCLWTGEEGVFAGEESGAYNWSCEMASYDCGSKDVTDGYTGFVVIWSSNQ